MSYATLRLGSQRVAVFIAAIPVLSLFFGRAIVGDGIHLYEAAAAMLVSAGIVIAGFFGRHRFIEPRARAKRQFAEWDAIQSRGLNWIAKQPDQIPENEQ